MTVGEKIRSYRNLRGISQKTLGELCQINEATIRKYEAEDRNPKPDQLLKIADALGVSINVFLEFDITTVSDVLSLIFKMDEDIDISFEGKKDKKGKIDPKTLSIRFDSFKINDKLSKWAYAKHLLVKTKASEDEFSSHEEYLEEVRDMEEKCEEIKQHLIDNNMVVKKGTEGIMINFIN